jgi:ATP/maltotriose-dependent transcriptional regulator MalT
LTPSERRIAQLAAHGLSNPEIAQALFATLRTRPKATEDYTKVDIAGV